MGYDYGQARKHLKTVTIKEVMIEKVITIGPDTKIHEAGQILIEKKIGCLPVIQGNTLVGMVTEADILQFYVSRHQKEIAGDSS